MNDSTIAFPVASPSATTVYTVTVTDPKTGCTSKAKVTVVVKNCTTGRLGQSDSQGDSQSLDAEQDSQEITIFPNPTSAEMTVKLPKNLNWQRIYLLNQKGVSVEEKGKTGDSEIKFDISQHPAGMYFIMVQTENAILTKKVAKQE